MLKMKHENEIVARASKCCIETLQASGNNPISGWKQLNPLETILHFTFYRYLVDDIRTQHKVQKRDSIIFFEMKGVEYRKYSIIRHSII